MGLVAGYAELRGEVAYRMSGPATAANKYEVPPHGELILGPHAQAVPPVVTPSHDSRRLSQGWSAPADLRDSIP
jgi:hypothetical protein